MNKKRKIEVCFSPFLYELFGKEDRLVVVVDVLRATSAMVTAFAHGATEIIPVKTPEEAVALGKQGYLMAGERNGETLAGFAYGNSPLAFTDDGMKGSRIVITTTNGTQAIQKASQSRALALGSFLNLQAVANWCMRQPGDLLVLCAGWKDKFNMEDTLFAGALAEQLMNNGNWLTHCDSTLAAMQLWESAGKDLYAFLENSSHRHRLSHLNLEEDIRFCLQLNRFAVVPEWTGNSKLLPVWTDEEKITLK
jgi:2-phosphosulfolactate phosphatase